MNGYIAQIDYNYRLPDSGDFAIYTYIGNNQISNDGQEEVLQIGIKAKKTAFEDLPPLNLAFVIDKSGSMKSNEKLDWVKESFEIFIKKVRDIDYVSLVIFSNDSQVIFSSTKMDSQIKRNSFKEAVQSIESGGGTNLVSGLQEGYSQVLANYRADYNNRVLFLTDGVGESDGILDMAETYRANGINVSTIGVGTDFDVNLMIELAKAGGGSSRFISDRDEMRETFGDELDRMIVPAAYNLKLTLEFPEYISLNETWGYRNEIIQNGVRYTIPTLHNGDYETILAEIDITGNNYIGNTDIAKLLVEYDDLKGKHVVLEPSIITAELIDNELPIYGISNYIVLKSSTMKFIAQKLIEIGNIYYNAQNSITQLNKKRYEKFNQIENINLLSAEAQSNKFNEITSDEILKLEEKISTDINKALKVSKDTRSKVLNNRTKLDNIGFDDELLILEKYIEIFGKELNYTENQIALSKIPEEIKPISNKISIDSYIDSMFRELILSIENENKQSIAVTPFSQNGGNNTPFTEYLDQSAQKSFLINNYTVIERNKIAEILNEQKLGLTGLIDTNNAISMGKLLSANYLVTGNVIPMNNSVIVFSRILNVTTGEVIAVAQVIIPNTKELLEMLIES